MMDELHERKEGTAKRNFHQNNDKLIEGKHFFSVPYINWLNVCTDFVLFIGGFHRGILTLNHLGYS
jgi:hypothetical protein